LTSDEDEWGEDGSLRVTSELKEIFFKTNQDKLTANATYLSLLFFWYYISYSDCRNLNKREVSSFPFSLDETKLDLKKKLAKEGENVLELTGKFLFPRGILSAIWKFENASFPTKIIQTHHR
jgi:hypothetical protein